MNHEQKARHFLLKFFNDSSVNYALFKISPEHDLISFHIPED